MASNRRGRTCSLGQHLDCKEGAHPIDSQSGCFRNRQTTSPVIQFRLYRRQYRQLLLDWVRVSSISIPFDSSTIWELSKSSNSNLLTPPKSEPQAGSEPRHSTHLVLTTSVHAYSLAHSSRPSTFFPASVQSPVTLRSFLPSTPTSHTTSPLALRTVTSLPARIPSRILQYRLHLSLLVHPPSPTRWKSMIV